MSSIERMVVPHALPRRSDDESTTTIAVVGGGIVGTACALRLQAGGHAVTVFDDDADGQAASWGNAGHIATEQVAPLASLALLRSAPRRLFAFGGPLDLRQPWRLTRWLVGYLAACAPSRHRAGRAALRELLVAAMPAWRDFVEDLGAPDLLCESGHLVCWGSVRAARSGRAAWRAADIGSAAIAPLSPELQTGLARVLKQPPAAAIAFTGTGQIIDHARLRRCIRERFGVRGGEWCEATVTALEKRNDGAWDAVLADGSARRFAQVVVCAGVRSAGLLEPSGWRRPLLAERGYHLHWSEHDWPSDLPPVAFEDRSVIATRFDSGLRLAGFVEYAPLDAPADPRKWEALARHARELGLPVRGTPQRWFGARPTLPDYLPAIGELPGHRGLFHAFGHQHLGLTLAPITALRIEALVRADLARPAS